jgi:hypothetical protein
MAPKAKKKAAAKPKSKAKAKASPEDIAARNRILHDFREFDLNGDGLLQKGELKALLKHLDPGNWTDDAVDRLVAGFDKDGDGDVSLEEFVDWITGVSAEDSEHDAFAEVLNKHHADADAINREHVQKELEHLKGINIASAVQAISSKELELIAHIENPAEPLQCLFALVWLLLQPSTCKASGKQVSFTQPRWPAVQHLLQDSSFIQRVCHIDDRRKEMTVSHTMVACYAVEEYFCLPKPGEERSPPLSQESIVGACMTHKLGRRGPALVLYEWCLSLLERQLRDTSRDRMREQAKHDFVQESKEKARAEQEAKDAKEIADTNKASEAILHEADELLAELDSL